MPDQRLSGFIKFYYLLRSEGLASNYLKNHPQGNFDLMFPLQEGFGYKSTHTHQKQKTGIIISGQHDQFFEFSFNKNSILLGVVFHAHSFHKFTPFPTKTLNNIAFDATDLLNRQYQELNSKLIESEGIINQINILNNFFLNQVKYLDYNLNHMEKLLMYIKQNAGLIPIKDLAFAANISERTLRRKVTEIIGISPKSYSKIIRFNNVLQFLKKQVKTDWQDIMFAYNYYDQNHFIKDFKNFTGFTPSSYYKSQNILSDFFLSQEELIQKDKESPKLVLLD